MIVLDEHHGVVAIRLLDHRIGEALVDQHVVLPVAGAKNGTNMGDVAERPHSFIGKSVVVAVFLFLGEPDASERVIRMIRWDLYPVVLVHHFPIGGAAAVGDPRSRAGSHHRFYRCHKSAGRSTDLDALLSFHMDVRLPIGDHDDLVSRQFLMEKVPQGVRGPGYSGVVRKTPLGVKRAQQGTQVSNQGLQFRVGRLGKGTDETFAPQHGPYPRHPSAPAQMGNENSNQGDDHTKHRKQDDDVLARVGAAPFNEAHVVDEYE